MFFHLLSLATQAKYPIGTVNTESGVNVRSGPGTTFGILYTLTYNSQVSIVGYSDDWWKIQYQGRKEGYCLSDYINVPAVCKAEGGLNIRSGPGTGYGTVGSIPEGASLTVTKRNNDEWYGVSYGGVNGYASAEYIELYIDGEAQDWHVTDDELSQLGLQNVNADELNKCLEKYSINTIARVRHFLTQVTYATRYGLVLEEKASGAKYEYNNILGNTEAGDGDKFKGAGYLQMRGRKLYELFSASVNDPEVLSVGSSVVASKYALDSAGFVWKHKGLNELCDTKSVTPEEVSRRLNDSYNGISEVHSIYTKAAGIWQDS